ncbi:MAG TPA: CoA transferase [Spirochaetia bacterium]|nr:CoA transferase [Spirochaetia bacterium]
MQPNGALSKIRILSFAQMAQGPSAVQYLADMGARVIKVERPGSGAYERSWSALNIFLNGESGFFLALNRNQKSITVDLKSPEGKEIIHALARDCDVLVENYRPGVMERLNLDYATLSKINPGLVYASASGYGSDGPYRDKAGQDMLAQVMSGLASVTGKRSDFPTPVGAAVVDVHSSSLLVVAILAALYYREQTGKGQKVEVNLLESAIDLQKEAFFYYMNGGEERSLLRSASGIDAPFYDAPHGIYETRNGYLAISLASLEKLGEVLNIEAIGAYTREEAFTRRDEIKDRIQQRIIENTTEEWLRILELEDIWCAPVKNYAEVIADPQVQHNRTVREMSRDDIGSFRVIGPPVHMSATPPELGAPPPRLGEHTNEILSSLGYLPDRIRELREKGVI